MQHRRLPLDLLLLAIASSCGAQELAERPAVLAKAPANVPSPGPYERPVTCWSDEARSWFQRGLMWTYGFNHDEAILCFRRAQEIEPTFAMAHWGEAHARGPNINDSAMDAERSAAAFDAAQRALVLVDDVSSVERALIEAQVARFAPDTPESRAHLDEAYAARMREAWATFPGDPEVGTLYAESLLNLHPWDQWETDPVTRERQPLHETIEVVDVLEEVLAAHPDHPGANHFYIHTVENSSTPERALPAARRIVDVCRHSGHLVHMASHVFHRLGHYAESLEANRQAVELDRDYLANAGRQGLYYFYFVHNQHFQVWSAMSMGRREEALSAARAIVDDAPEYVREEMGEFLDPFLAVPIHAAIRFGLWEDVLAAPDHGSGYPIHRAFRHYGRGIAFAARGEIERARSEQRDFAIAQRAVIDGMVIGNNPAPPVMRIAEAMLEGEILYREGAFDAAFRELSRAASLEDGLRYDEPSAWMQPVRHALGALLLEQDRPDEAESVFREDLVRNPENGWALHGLARALEAQGKNADGTFERFRAAWTHADVPLEVECFCAARAARVASETTEGTLEGKSDNP